MSDALLSARHVTVQYEVDDQVVQAVNDATFDVYRGETLGLVGETGAGKTTIALSIMGLLPMPPAVVKSGEIVLNGQSLLTLGRKQLSRLRGKEMAMIFQDPMTALNPTDFVGDQIREVLLLHERLTVRQATERAREMLETVGIPRERYAEYPHQFSGGMRQRVVIAMALACNPHLLIADEPTTALDVTIQAQILNLMNQLKREKGTSVILITHDFGVVAETCDRVAVIYAGEIIEMGTVRQVFKHSAHPYTAGLFLALPSVSSKTARRLKPIAGATPDPTCLPESCKFAPRCPYRTEACQRGVVPVKQLGDGHWVRCHLPLSREGGE